MDAAAPLGHPDPLLIGGDGANGGAEGGEERSGSGRVVDHVQTVVMGSQQLTVGSDGDVLHRQGGHPREPVQVGLVPEDAAVGGREDVVAVGGDTSSPLQADRRHVFHDHAVAEPGPDHGGDRLRARIHGPDRGGVQHVEDTVFVHRVGRSIVPGKDARAVEHGGGAVPGEGGHRCGFHGHRQGGGGGLGAGQGRSHLYAPQPAVAGVDQIQPRPVMNGDSGCPQPPVRAGAVEESRGVSSGEVQRREVGFQPPPDPRLRHWGRFLCLPILHHRIEVVAGGFQAPDGSVEDGGQSVSRPVVPVQALGAHHPDGIPIRGELVERTGRGDFVCRCYAILSSCWIDFCSMDLYQGAPRAGVEPAVGAQHQISADGANGEIGRQQLGAAGGQRHADHTALAEHIEVGQVGGDALDQLEAGLQRVEPLSEDAAGDIGAGERLHRPR